MYIAILGRQPALSIAELEAVYGTDKVRWFSDQSALVDTDTINVERLGGSIKAGKVSFQLHATSWNQVSTKIIREYTHLLRGHEGKVTLGISVYDTTTSSREVQKVGLGLKQQLKRNGVNVRLIPNAEAALSSATSHHNKLGLSPNKVEILVVRNRAGSYTVALSTGSQNITSLARRDQERPKRDTFVGMLPPKLAQIILNLAVGPSEASREKYILDPFCGTGVILQEALLIGFNAYGTDLSEKMIDYSRTNSSWLIETFSHRFSDSIEQPVLEVGDAMTHTWNPIPFAVASEAYLGQPFNTLPSREKLMQVRDNCNHIISEFLENLSRQLPSKTRLCLAVPAWRLQDNSFLHLSLIQRLTSYGFTPIPFSTVSQDELLYYREDQVVARQLLVLERS